MSTILGILLLTVAPIKPSNIACDLDDCHLADALHQADEHGAVQDRWSWMNHDLALARIASLQGNYAKSLRLVASLDTAIRNGLSQLLIDRGSESVLSLHDALKTIAIDSKGHPLAPLEITMVPIARHHHSKP
jgi:hypothetical protein